MIDWDKLDYRFETLPIVEPYRIAAYSTNDEVIRDVACRAIAKHNADRVSVYGFVDNDVVVVFCVPSSYFFTKIYSGNSN